MISRQFVELALVLFISLLVGFEREEYKAHAPHYVFGGVTTFPLLGLIGYGLARLSGGTVAPIAAGFVVIGGLMAISYWHKVNADPAEGVATELSALLTYVAGTLVYAGTYWLAVAIGVILVLILELRVALERLSTRVGRDEVAAFAKFLALAIVILPVLPNRSFTRFDLNPFRVWLVLVVVSGLSYASYVLQKWLEGRGGVLLTALLGGAYSSTATTVVLARQGKLAGAPRVYAGAMLSASGVMYLRMVVLVAFFDISLAKSLGPGFAVLAIAAIGTGVAIALRGERGREPGRAVAGAPSQDAAGAPPQDAAGPSLRDAARAPDRGSERAPALRVATNPLELRPAFLFAAVFVIVIVLTRLATEHVGRAGLYGLAVLMGLSDVDPFVLSLAQGQTHGAPLRAATAAIVISAAANNLAKGVYARAFGDAATGRLALLLLGALTLAGLVPLVTM